MLFYLVNDGVSLTTPIASPESPLFKKYTPLQLSILNKNPSITVILINMITTINCDLPNKMTIFQYSIKNNFLDVILALLRKGIDVNRNFFELSNPFTEVLESYNLNVLKLLIKYGLNIDQMISGKSLISYAIDKGHPDVAIILIESGCDLSEVTNRYSELLQFSDLTQESRIMKIIKTVHYIDQNIKDYDLRSNTIYDLPFYQTNDECEFIDNIMQSRRPLYTANEIYRIPFLQFDYKSFTVKQLSIIRDKVISLMIKGKRLSSLPPVFDEFNQSLYNIQTIICFVFQEQYLSIQDLVIVAQISKYFFAFSLSLKKQVGFHLLNMNIFDNQIHLYRSSRKRSVDLSVIQLSNQNWILRDMKLNLCSSQSRKMFRLKSTFQFS